MSKQSTSANSASHSPHRITAPPGSAAYQAQMLEQGQAAMDRALAMPLTRLAFGTYLAVMVLLVMGLCSSSVSIIYEGRWSEAVTRLMLAVLLVPMLFGIASVACTGRSLRRWFVEIIMRYQARPPASAQQAPREDK
ncbi:MAG: hypothetical protein KF708_22355 [Pirellulales bacterium]|nr:hypothetical protein [Pirellulales bacterium]